MTLGIGGMAQCLSMPQADARGAAPAQGGGFLQAVARQYGAQADGPAPAAKPAKAADTAAMTMGQYRQYIYDKISGLPVNPSKALAQASVTISDEGLQAMKDDPGYEGWVLDKLAENFSAYDPWCSMCGGSYSTHYFGATKEAYHGEGWYPGYDGGQGEALFGQKAEESFWERRMAAHEKNMELSQELWLKEQALLSQEKRRASLGSDEEEAPYLAGVPASLLLSFLM